MIKTLLLFLFITSTQAAFNCESFKSRGFCQFREPQNAAAMGCLDIVGKLLLLEDLILCQESTAWSNAPCPTAKRVATCQYGDTDHLTVRHFYAPYTQAQATTECLQTGGEACAQ
jgi:hypothetical protein